MMNFMTQDFEYREVDRISRPCTFVFEKKFDDEGAYWEAHCLELNVFAMAQDLDQALRDIQIVSQEMFVEFLNHGGEEGLAKRRASEERFAAMAQRIASMSPRNLPWTEVCQKQDELSFVRIDSEVKARKYLGIPLSSAAQPKTEQHIDLWDIGMAS